jgi:glycosyltransferase involved in cell wall biosynthesis
MHILQVLNTLGPGGAEAYVVHLSNDLVSRGIKVTVIADGDMTLADRLPRQVDLVRVGPLVGGGFGPFSSASNLVRKVPEFRRFLDSSAVTVVHTHLIASGLGFWLAGRMERVPTLHTAMHVRDHGSRSEKLAYDSRLPGRLVDRFLALSDWFRDELIMNWHIPRRRVVTIRSGIDVNRFQPHEATRAACRAGWGVGPRTLVCGALARLEPEKGLELAIRSVAHAVQNGAPDLVFLLAGRGREEERLKQLVASLGVDCNVRFPGYVSDPARILPGFDVYLQTTIGPNLGFSSLEALSTGVPLLIAARSPEERAMAEDTLIDLSAGWIEDATPERIGSRLARITNSPGCEDKKLAARRVGLENYNWESHVERMIALYEDMSSKLAIQAEHSKRGNRGID